jgi:RNA polymerase sigma factor (sigma-70 family)
VSELAEHTDAQLVAGVLAGDREAFAAIYDRYADRLHDFCHAVLRDRDEAADAVQDTFVLVAQRLAQLNDPERLRPWLYAVARSVALRMVRARRRVVLNEVEDMADTDPGPDRAAEQVALRELVWSAAAGLSERDRALLDLHVRQGLDGADLGEAMGVSPGHAYVLLTRLRDQVERSLGALLIARQGRRDCSELDALLSGWDGRYTPLMRKRVARHVDSCEVCADRKRIMVSPFALLAAVPFVAAPLWVRDRVLENVQLAAYDGPLEPADDLDFLDDAGDLDDLDTLFDEKPGSGPEGTAPAAARGFLRQRTRIAAAAAAVLALLVVAGAVAYWRGGPTSGEPLGLDLPAPAISGSTSGSGTSSSAPDSVTSTSAIPIDDDITFTDDADPDDPGVITTTTTRPADPPPDGPPDPPDPPGDTTNPAIGRAVVSPSDIGCGERASASALITDDVGVTGATVSWSGPGGSGSAGMAPDGDTWFASVGPFTADGSVAWTITATDAAGNQATAGGKNSVVNCVTIGR